jgi:restriction system protein
VGVSNCHQWVIVVVVSHLGAVLAIVSPKYREWLRSQDGFKFRLSKLPGMKSDSPVTLAIATAIYTLPLSIFGWITMQEVFSDFPTTLTAAVISSIGVIVLIGWFIEGWGTSKSTNDTKEETSRIEYFERIERLEEIKQLDPVEFERFVGTLFERMGYDVEMTAKSGDEGVDLVLHKDSKLAVVQCKRYEGSVGQPVVRDLYGAMVHNRAEKAYLITTGTITLPAQGWAKGKQIHLVDGSQLVDWIEVLERESEEDKDQEEEVAPPKPSFGEVINSLKGNWVAIGALVMSMILPLLSCSTGLLVFHQSSTTPTPTVTVIPDAPQSVTQSPLPTDTPRPTETPKPMPPIKSSCVPARVITVISDDALE